MEGIYRIGLKDAQGEGMVTFLSRSGEPNSVLETTTQPQLPGRMFGIVFTILCTRGDGEECWVCNM